MKLLVLQHVLHENLGYIAEYAKDRNISIDVLTLWKQYSMPDPTGYSGVIILGGPMGVYEDFPSKNDEIALIRKIVGHVPILGICLGSQLLAHVLGAAVKPNPAGKEIGYYTLTLTEAGKKSPILDGFSSNVRALEWHGDAFELPENSELLVSSSVCANQAFSFNNAYGLLFHFEFTPEMVKKQIEIDRKWTHEDFYLDEDKLAREADELVPLMKQQCYRLLENFLR